MDEHTAPSQRSDEDIRQDALKALWGFEPIRQTQPPVSVRVEHGIVTVSGVVRSRIISQRLVGLLGEIPGVVQVKSEIANDAAIELEIAHQLATDERTRHWPTRIWVTSFHGEVRLEGKVSDEVVRSAAEELAGAVHGVCGLTNALV